MAASCVCVCVCASMPQALLQRMPRCVALVHFVTTRVPCSVAWVAPGSPRGSHPSAVVVDRGERRADLLGDVEGALGKMPHHDSIRTRPPLAALSLEPSPRNYDRGAHCVGMCWVRWETRSSGCFIRGVNRWRCSPDDVALRARIFTIVLVRVAQTSTRRPMFGVPSRSVGSAREHRTSLTAHFLPTSR